MRSTCAYHPRNEAVARDVRGWVLCESCADERGVEKWGRDPEQEKVTPLDSGSSGEVDR